MDKKVNSKEAYQFQTIINLKAYMVIGRMSEEEVAADLGLGVQTIQRWLSGVRKPAYPTRCNEIRKLIGMKIEQPNLNSNPPVCPADRAEAKEKLLKHKDLGATQMAAEIGMGLQAVKNYICDKGREGYPGPENTRKILAWNPSLPPYPLQPKPKAEPEQPSLKGLDVKSKTLNDIYTILSEIKDLLQQG